MLFDPFNSFMPALTRPGFVPPVDVAVGEHDLVLTMDAPGLTADDVSLELLGGELVVRGERRRPELTEGAQWAVTERGFGRFERRIRLPRGIDPDAITANLDNGVLSLILPKPETLKPRAIRIGSGGSRTQIEATATS